MNPHSNSKKPAVRKRETIAVAIEFKSSYPIPLLVANFVIFHIL